MCLSSLFSKTINKMRTNVYFNAINSWGKNAGGVVNRQIFRRRKISIVEKAEVYAEEGFQLEATETNKDNNNIILLYILVDIRHYSKHFTYINSFNLHNILWGRYYYFHHFTIEETEAWGQIICPRSHSQISSPGYLGSNSISLMTTLYCHLRKAQWFEAQGIVESRNEVWILVECLCRENLDFQVSSPSSSNQASISPYPGRRPEIWSMEKLHPWG